MPLLPSKTSSGSKSSPSLRKDEQAGLSIESGLRVRGEHQRVVKELVVHLHT